jgi:hypothetical protein
VRTVGRNAVGISEKFGGFLAIFDSKNGRFWRFLTIQLTDYPDKLGVNRAGKLQILFWRSICPLPMMFSRISRAK